MKRALVYSLLALLLGGCVVVPYGYRDDDGYRHRYEHHEGYPGYGYDGFRHYDHG
jgi:hypothetical protein